ncbi:flagellar basal body rod protein FlgB [Alkalimarinus sediminis]|uniref:Flagellar basal body rod protein FlgB n=1 Tax=Alkalimarinus sediminis TaxID=1632866 RepID=A0A9E8HNJ5_9ALTE|nr:flagellar basal body rod protein FlgB [Alkalimarinus sediminis]UZW75873.1 flagellar basal body rod protein FlgB [Alkalimarinus sediminis]
MSISFDNALGIHEKALNFRVKRAEVLANNLANADTPGFKARDLDFKAALNSSLNQFSEPGAMAMAKTNSKHLTTNAESADSLLYRNPTQPSIDGNTVDTQQETAAYMKNAMDYQASFQFLNSKFKGLTRAIKGE